MGEAVVRHNALRLRSVQDSLARHGVQLVFVIAPSKATFMPENLPRFAHRSPGARTNYAAYVDAFEAAGVHVLDFSRALRQWRSTAPHPLFTSGGVHWSIYGGARAADSLQGYLRRRLGVAPAPFRLANIETSTTPRDTDDDMSKTLNMLLSPPSETLAYPKLVFDTLPAAPPKPNLLLIGDSFGWTWVGNNFLGNAFSEKSHFWFYNYQVAWAGSELTAEGREIWRLKLKEHYLARDVIVLLFNEQNLKGFDFGFTQEVFNIFNPYTPAEQVRYDTILTDLRLQVAWEKAQLGGDTLELRLRRQATTALDQAR